MSLPPDSPDDNPAIPLAVTALCPALSPLLIRSRLLEQKQVIRARRYECRRLLNRKTTPDQDKSALLTAENDCLLEERRLEEILESEFLPQHGQHQLISPRLFLETPLFRVASRSATRERECELTIALDDKDGPIIYSGPELRQEDGLVFMALVNSVRDIRLGSVAQFVPADLCRAVFNHYDGRARVRLKTYILNLLKGQIRTRNYAVQLCQRFDFPAQGMWSVRFDPDIVRLFAGTHVWMDLKVRLRLPDGLATWLLGYVEAQTRLIPMKIEVLRRLCGSDAEERAFTNLLRKALEHLKTHGVIDEGYKLKEGQVRWRKPRPVVNENLAMGAVSGELMPENRSLGRE